MNSFLLHTANRKIRTGQRWTLVAWWARTLIRIKRELAPLPTPSLSAFPTLLLRLYKMHRMTVRHSGTVLEWVTFLATKRPDLMQSLFAAIPASASASTDVWKADIVEAVARSGRVALLVKCMAAFRQDATELVFKQRLLKWIESSDFMKPRIVKVLITYIVQLLEELKINDQLTTPIIRKLWKSPVVMGTITQIAPWLSRKLPEDLVERLCTSTRYPKVIATAMRNTPLGKTLYLQAKWKAAVRLTRFFTRNVSLAALRQVNRGDCAVCWNSRILWSLHEERRHAVCSRCIQRLRKIQHEVCPVCRTAIQL